MGLGEEDDMRTLLKRLMPKFMIRKLAKSSIKIPHALPSSLVFKVAQGQGELKQCFELYKSMAYRRDIRPVGDREFAPLIQHALPTTSHLVAMKDNKVIAAVSIIKDSSFKMPLEEYIDISYMKRRGQNMAQVYCLTVLEDYVDEFGDYYLPFMKYILKYCSEVAKISQVFFIAPYDQSAFYEDVLLARKLPQMSLKRIKDKVKDHGIGYYIDFSADLEKKYFEAYAHYPKEKNLYRLFFGARMFESHYVYPVRKYYKCTDPVLNKDLLHKFFVNDSNVFNKLSLRDKETILMMYNQKKFFRVDQNNKVITRENYRFRSSVKAKTKYNVGLTIKELSRGGFKTNFTSFLSKDKNLESEFLIEVSPGRIAAVKAKPTWWNSWETGYIITESCQEWDDYVTYLEKDLASDQKFGVEIFDKLAA